MTGKEPWDLTSGPVAVTLVKLALPTLAASLMQSLQGSINSIWISRLVGPEGLGASYAVNVLLFLLSSLVFGFGVAANVEIGQALGRKNLELARRVFGTTIGFFAIMGTFFVTLIWFYASTVFAALSVPDTVSPLATAYAHVILISTPAAFLLLLIMMCLRGFGDALTPLWLMIGLVIGDALLNPLFILGLGPVPAMGIAGSGAATIVSTYAALSLAVAYIYLRDLPLRLRGREFRFLIPSPIICQRLIAKGGPVGLQMLTASSASMLMIKLVSLGGNVTLAAFAAASQIWTYVQMPSNAIGAAVSAVASQNIGAGRWDRVGVIARTGVIFGLGMTFTLTAVATFCAPIWVSWFFPKQSAEAILASRINLIVCWSFTLMSVSAILTAVLRSNRVVWIPLLITFLSLYPARLGFSAVMEPRWGTEALWWSFPAGFLISLLLTSAFFALASWRRMPNASSLN